MSDLIGRLQSNGSLTGMLSSEASLSGRLSLAEPVTVEQLNVVKNGTYTAAANHAYSPVNVNVPKELAFEDIKDVMFMDYDGEVVASYDAADFIANVTSLPTPPAHDGLTFQEWNWTLADIKDELQNGSGACCIGACYTTNDGNTHFFIKLDERESMRLQLYFQKYDSSMLTVDWGDGTTSTTTSSTYLRHLYSAYGEYEVTINCSSNWSFNPGTEGFRSIPLTDAECTGSYYTHATFFLKEVWFGTTGRICYNNYNLFRGCYGLKSVSVHKDIFYNNGQQMNLSNMFQYSNILFFTVPAPLASVTTTHASPMSNWFVACKNLITVSYPKGFKYLLANPFSQSGIRFFFFPAMDTWDCKASYCQFQYCIRLERIAMKFDNFTTTSSTGFNSFLMYAYNIKKVSWEKMKIPSTVTTRYLCYIGYGLTGEVTLPATFTRFVGDEFSNCYSVTKFTMLGDITAVGTVNGYVFASDVSCLEWDFTHCTSVPTLYNTNCFSGIRPTAKIKVPASLEASWKAASGWSTYANYIVGV